MASQSPTGAWLVDERFGRDGSLVESASSVGARVADPPTGGWLYDADEPGGVAVGQDWPAAPGPGEPWSRYDATRPGGSNWKGWRNPDPGAEWLAPTGAGPAEHRGSNTNTLDAPLPGWTGAGISGSTDPGRDDDDILPAFIEEIWPTDPHARSTNSWLSAHVSREDAIVLTRALRQRHSARTVGFVADDIAMDTDALINPPPACDGRLCWRRYALTNRELDSTTMLRDWLAAGGIARDVVELLQYLVASAACSDSPVCQSDDPNVVSTCWLVSSEIYNAVWETPAERDYFEWIHKYYCCCIDQIVYGHEPPGEDIPKDE